MRVEGGRREREREMEPVSVNLTALSEGGDRVGEREGGWRGEERREVRWAWGQHGKERSDTQAGITFGVIF